MLVDTLFNMLNPNTNHEVETSMDGGRGKKRQASSHGESDYDNFNVDSEIYKDFRQTASVQDDECSRSDRLGSRPSLPEVECQSESNFARDGGISSATNHAVDIWQNATDLVIENGNPSELPLVSAGFVPGLGLPSNQNSGFLLGQNENLQLGSYDNWESYLGSVRPQTEPKDGLLEVEVPWSLVEEM